MQRGTEVLGIRRGRGRPTGWRRLGPASPRLPEAQREVVLLHDLEGWKHEEIAESSTVRRGWDRASTMHGAGCDGSWERRTRKHRQLQPIDLSPLDPGA